MRFLHRLLIYVLLALGAITCLIPLLWMVSTGLKPVDQTMSMPPTWIPYRFYVEKDGTLTEIQKGDLDKYPNSKIVRKIAPRWDNFGSAIKYMKYFPLYLKNTLILCILTVVGTVASSALTAYGFARVDWRGRDKVFLVALATMMVPFPVVMVPMYCLFRWLGWIGTLKPLWVGSFPGIVTKARQDCPRTGNDKNASKAILHGRAYPCWPAPGTQGYMLLAYDLARSIEPEQVVARAL